MREDWTGRRRTERSRLAALSAVAQAGGDISTFEHTDHRPAIQPARLIAIGALIAALLGLVAVLATSFALSGVGSRAAVGHSRSASARSAQASLPSTFAESPSFTLPFPPNRADRPTRRGEVPRSTPTGWRARPDVVRMTPRPAGRWRRSTARTRSEPV